MVLSRRFPGAFMSEENAKPNRKLLEPQLVAAEYHENPWIATPGQGTTIADMLVPEYWGNVAARMRRGDIIRVRPADFTWFAELIVLAVGPFTAKVFRLRHFEFDAKPEATVLAIPAGYDVKHRGKNGWCIIRKSDNAVLKESEPSQASAVLWLDNHLKTFAA
jgi:hypothetical protein